MNIGEKIVILKESAGFKNYKEFGDFVGLPNDWCLELSKRTEVTNIDITRLQRIAYKFNVTIDWLLSETDGEIKLDKLPEDDVSTMLDKLKEKITEGVKFEGTIIAKDTEELIHDSIDVIKILIRHNL